MVEALGGEYIYCTVDGPLSSPVKACYGIAGDTAVMETAQASGLTLISARQRNPLLTSTYGTGQMIVDAVKRGCRKVLIGIGGSATNDGGMGMLAALGVIFTDEHGNVLKPCGENLERVRNIDLGKMMPQINDTQFYVACDVDNPLYGPRGAAAVFAPQKGADADMVKRLDTGLRVYAAALAKAVGRDCSQHPGAGAAGGLGVAFEACLNAMMKPGIELVLDMLDFDSKVKDAALVITGEGKMDRQTLMGKTPAGILRRSHRYGVPVAAIAGSISDYEALLSAGFLAVLPVVAGPCSLEKAMEKESALLNVGRTAENIVRLFF